VSLFGLTDLVGPLFFLLFVFLILVIMVFELRRSGGRNLRDIPAFARLIRAIGLAVEDGNRLHLSLGRGEITGPRSAAGFIGLSVLARIARTASVSDAPPVATVGEGALSILTQDTLASAYQEIGIGGLYDPSAGQMTGVTPFSYAAGALPVVRDEDVSANILVGSYGVEVALLLDAAERSGSFTLAGTDSVPGQAVLYAAAQEPLVGEELYAAGAYLRAGAVHTASLKAQDVLRWLIILAILVGGLAQFFEGLLP
jgi:hypothetical protein